jgi:predicted ATPase/class 3 adenylate cyclase
VHGQSGVTTYLFTDIEGSTRLWEQEPERMRPALARHDALSREAVEAYRGVVVKSTGDGIHAVFGDPLDALLATLQLQLALDDPQATQGLALRVRAGLHAGVDERRDNDFFGPVVNRAARIMAAAHGGQILLSQAVVSLVSERLPDNVQLRNLGAVRLRDLTSAELVYQIVHARLRQDFPALRSLEATPNNLPQQVTSFIGRETELADVRKLLGATRLLTLLGMGGLGKTRLSLQVAAEVLDDYPDGVWFVELAALTDGSLVQQAVAFVLGVKEEAGHPVIDALMKFVAQRRLLIVLDNCEHLVRACAEVAKRLLQSGPGLRILTSSREAMHMQGETTYAVPALAVPAESLTNSVAALTQFEAVRLFLDRAAAAKPAFELTEQNAAAVIGICRRLDGIPLAIELAAARMRALSVEAIADRLNDRFRLLTQGDRTALPRQQTLRALIDWSYDLLMEHERAMFRQLAVFAAGWTLEAVEAICADGEIQHGDVLDRLSRLVEKSLVAQSANGERYHLLDTVREYAQQRLIEAGEEEQARNRHLDFYLSLSEKARPELLGPNQGTWLAKLDLEQENLLLAHAWCDRAPGGTALGFRLVPALKAYMFNRGLLGLGLRVSVEALARTEPEPRNLARCRTLFTAGQFACFMGNYEEAQQFLEESIVIARQFGDKVRVAAALQPLGIACLGRGDLAAARGHLEEALAIARELGNKHELPAAINALAQLHRAQGALDEAEPLYEQVVAIGRELGHHEITAVGLLNLAMVHTSRASTDRAGKLLVDVLAIAERIGSRPAGQSAIEVSAGLAASCEDWVNAARFFGAAEAQMESTGIHRDPADDAFLKPLVARARSAVSAAEFAAADSAGRALSYDAVISEVRAWLGQRC